MNHLPKREWEMGLRKSDSVLQDVGKFWISLTNGVT